MKLYLDNIGKIKESNIKIDGITVIGGENNTGKSTVGKALYSLINSFYNIRERVFNEKMASLINSITISYLGRLNSIEKDKLNFYGFYLIDAIETYLYTNENNFDPFSNFSKENFTTYVLDSLVAANYDGEYDINVIEDVSDKIKEKIREINEIEDEKILEYLLKRTLNEEFNSQPKNIFSKQDGVLSLKINNQDININLGEYNSVDIIKKTSLSTRAVYLDDPSTIDNLVNLRTKRRIINHKDMLANLLQTGLKKNIVDEIILEQKLANTLKKLNSICIGEITRSNNKIGYKLPSSDKVLDIRNLSMGLKSFEVIKTLLIKGLLQANGILILDEPEIHLHPEWQLIFAEIIVLLQIEFGLHILMTTHSPYFLNAIEIYSKNYGIEDRCNYYLAYNKENYAVIDDVTDNLESIYETLARPLQVLENKKYEQV